MIREDLADKRTLGPRPKSEGKSHAERTEYPKVLSKNMVSSFWRGKEPTGLEKSEQEGMSKG